MSADPLDRVTHLLREVTADTGDVQTRPPRRDEAIELLADALRARARARRRRRAAGALAVAASIVAAAASVAGIWHARGVTPAESQELGHVDDPTNVAAARDGQPLRLAPGARVVAGTELRVLPGAESRLSFDSGTSVTLGDGARVRIVDESNTKAFAVEAGSLFARVAKLRPDERFLVTTADAEVEVRGTAFRVTVGPSDPACGGGTPTRLEVVEGTVVLRHAGHAEAVTAGQRWPRCDERPTNDAAGARAAPAFPPRDASGSAAPAHALVPTEAPHRSSPPPPAKLRESQLSAQNDLFDEAMRARREGRRDAALATLNRLVASYPDGPLAESATAERFRVLRGVDRVEAAAAAHTYLTRWPEGFARKEAEAVVAEAR